MCNIIYNIYSTRQEPRDDRPIAMVHILPASACRTLILLGLGSFQSQPRWPHQTQPSPPPPSRPMAPLALLRRGRRIK